jgi:hypothetical protein
VADLSSYENAAYEAMSPSLLARQPVTEPKSPKVATMEWATVFGKLEGVLNGLRDWRWSWWTHWSVLAAFFLPFRYTFLNAPNKMIRGSPINDQILDSTGLQAVRTCAAGMWTGLTSPSRQWFAIDLARPDEDELDAEGRAWIEDTQRQIFDVLARSNFYDTMAQGFQDVTVFGTAPVVIYEDFQDIIRCYLPAAGEYFLGAGPRLDIDTFDREFTLNVKQIVGMFDVENCPVEVTKLWMQGGASLTQEFVVAHSIEPNFAFNDMGGGPPIQFVPAGFTYREVYWLRGMSTDKPLSVRGFYDKPFMVARWATVSNDAYGRSPCMDALGDNKQVQTETARKAEFIEKGVRPPMGADPSLKNEPASIIPAAITYMDTTNGRKGFFPLFEPDPNWLVGLTKDIEGVNARIESCLFVDLFMAITRMEGVQPRNELELSERNQERLQELGPFVHMFEGEFASPAIRRIIGILRRRGLLKPVPQSLRAIPLKINYISIMKIAQQAREVVSMKDVFVQGANMSLAAKNAGLPDPLRQLNIDKSFRRYGKNLGFDEDLWFTADEVEEQDAQRAQAQQQAQMPEMAMQGVEAAQTLSQTPLTDGTALSALLAGSPA